MAFGTKVTTTNKGADYVQECINAGVPVPTTVLDTGAHWQVSPTAVAHPFMSPSLENARLWTFENTPLIDGPDGICMALPRSHATFDATVVGVICMGWNGKTCYFTNPANTTFGPIAAINVVEKLIGGADLSIAPEGMCTDCHAGENPFIIHPDDPAFIWAIDSVSRVFPDTWPTPIVPDGFPGNPVPLDQLGPVTDSQLKCDTCHALGASGGRLPQVSTAYTRFCNEVLAPAVGQAAPIPNTMPRPGHGALADYGDHVAWLGAACDANPGGGVVVPFVPPSITVRPPDVDPPYICTKYVHVSNAVYGATLKLYVNNVLKGTGTFRNPDAGYVFALVTELVAADILEVSQTVGGITSMKTLVRPLNPADDYGNVLPAPIIAPTPLYKCATAIAVLQIPGAELTTVKTPPGGMATSYTLTTGSRYSWVAGLGNPAFTIDTALKVRQKLCGVTSPYSPSSLVEDAPATLPKLAFSSPLTVGQTVIRVESIVQGSSVNITETNSATVVFNNSSVPAKGLNIDLSPTLVKVLATHHIVPTQALCGVNSGDPTVPTPVACNEASLVPRIATPLAGDAFVIVTSSVPGSTVRVFDALATEIGNGSGIAVDLSRKLVAGEIINVAASLPTCTVNSAFSIMVAG